MIYTTYFANLHNLPKEIVPIAICAKPPKWWKGLSYRNLAPPYDVLMNYKRGGSERDYIREYMKRVIANLDVHAVWKELSELAGGKQFALVCYEKRGEFCHRHIVAEWFFNHGYLAVEYGKE